MVAKWPLEVEIAMGAPVPISVSSGHFALRYEVPKFLARGGHLCMAVLTIIAVTVQQPAGSLLAGRGRGVSHTGSATAGSQAAERVEG